MSDIAPPVPLHMCNRGLIESALAVPHVGWPGEADKYLTLEEKAAALGTHLARSQPCIDGNKRVALILMTTFLWINGRRLTATVAASLEPADMMRDAANAQDEDAVIAFIAEWLERTTMPR